MGSPNSALLWELQVLSNVFVPLLSQQAGTDKRSAMMPVSDDRGQSSLLNEFLADLNKFVGQVGQTMHELQGKTMLSASIVTTAGCGPLLFQEQSSESAGAMQGMCICSCHQCRLMT